jgi:hypothetical protein
MLARQVLLLLGSLHQPLFIFGARYRIQNIHTTTEPHSQPYDCLLISTSAESLEIKTFSLTWLMLQLFVDQTKGKWQDHIKATKASQIRRYSRERVKKKEEEEIEEEDEGRKRQRKLLDLLLRKPQEMK